MAEIGRDEAVRYLLGQGPEAERETLERRLFEDESLAEEVEIFEDELVDAYVGERLSPAERGRFEEAYLSSPERAAKVAFARVLDRRLATDRPASLVSRSHWSRLVPLAAFLVLALGGAYFGLRFAQARRELTRLEQQQAALKSQIAQALGERSRLERAIEESRTEIAKLERQVAGAVAFTLDPGLLRDSGGRHILVIPAGATVVQLSAPIPFSGYRLFTAILRTPEGVQVWHQQDILPEPGAKALTLIVPARVLTSGDYILSLTGVTPSGRTETVADFAFRVKSN